MCPDPKGRAWLGGGRHLPRHALHADHALEHCLVGVVGIVALVNDSRAVDKQDGAAELDVLPDLGLSRDGGHAANLLPPAMVRVIVGTL